MSLINISSTSKSEDQVLLGSGHEQWLISCLLLNARSLVIKWFEFKAMLKNREPKVVAVTVTFLDPEILNSEFVACELDGEFCYHEFCYHEAFEAQKRFSQD